MKRFIPILLLLSSCVTTTADKNVSYGSLSRDQRLGQVHLNIEVALEDYSQRPVEMVEIEVSGQTDSDQGKTDKYGRADIALSIYENETLDFRFYSKSKKIEWTKTIVKFPAGKTDLTYLFRTTPKGSIELIEESY